MNGKTISDEHLFMTVEGVAMLADGTRRPVQVDITFGQVRAYRDDPHPCQCEDCQKTFGPAVSILSLQEDYFADKITEKQFLRRMKRLGFYRAGKVQRH
jgi:hypothetical protein